MAHPMFSPRSTTKGPGLGGAKAGPETGITSGATSGVTSGANSDVTSAPLPRRRFLAGATATLGLLSTPVWGKASGDLFLTAASKPGNATFLVGLNGAGAVQFTLPLPGRGHAAAAHPERAEAVAFARRPGRFAFVLDCTTGDEIARLDTPAGLHFYGHGAFTADGRYLLTTENAFDVPDGRIGIWDAARGYARVGDVPSGGLGPHEILALPSGGFVVANGGIETHPDMGRAKLNIPTMQPNLSYLSADGTVEDSIPAPKDQRLNSIRHIAVDQAGTVAIALQWQGDVTRRVPLLARHRRGEALRYLDHPGTVHLKNYAGSVAQTRDGSEIAITGPKGGHVLFFDGQTGAPKEDATLPTASGVARIGAGLLITIDGGLAQRQRGQITQTEVPGDWSWDNHLVAV